MGLREKGYWLSQAEALRRREVATMAHAIGLALASKEESERAWDDLELTKTAKDSRNERAKSTWGMMNLSFRLNGGKGV